MRKTDRDKTSDVREWDSGKGEKEKEDMSGAALLPLERSWRSLNINI